MNLAEFRAWFEGFTEGISGQPTKKQWERIKDRVSEITNEATPYPIYVDRYVYPYRQWWYPQPTCGGWTTLTASQGIGSSSVQPTASNYGAHSFNDVGRAEYLQLEAA